MGTQDRGFAAMDESKQRELASKGGHSSHSSGGNFKNDPAKASEAGKRGAASQSTEAKAKGGKHRQTGRS